MKNRSFTIEHALYTMVAVLAIVVRLVDLGTLGLSDFEAEWALRALDASLGRPVDPGNHPGYVVITGFLFFLFNSSAFLARLLPALAGAGLVALPFVYRKSLGRMPALLAAFILAFEPAFISTARLVGGPALAVTLLLAALAALNFRKPVAAGIFTGLALLAGPSLYLGGVVLGVAILLASVFGVRWPAWQETDPDPFQEPWMRNFGFALVGSILLAGTLFLRFPQGLGALANPLIGFLERWAVQPEVEQGRLWLTLMASQPLVLILGVIGGVTAWVREEAAGKFLVLWMLSAVLFLVLFPGRQVFDLVWLVLPLVLLAARWLGQPDFWVFSGESGWISIGLALLLIVLQASIWLNLTGLNYAQPGEQVYLLRLVVILGAVILGGLSVSLVMLGYDNALGWRGLVWGVALGMLFGMLASVWGDAGSASEARRNPWMPTPLGGQEALLVETIGDLGSWAQGSRESLDIAVMVDYPSVRWALRDLPAVRFGSAVENGELPSALITDVENTSLNLASSYRGQDFTWRVYPDWNGMRVVDWLRWLAFRTTPTGSEHIILWARGTIFPGQVLQGTDLFELTPGESVIPDVPADEFIREDENPVEDLPVK
jgi:hypothetical protein